MSTKEGTVPQILKYSLKVLKHHFLLFIKRPLVEQQELISYVVAIKSFYKGCMVELRAKVQSQTYSWSNI